MIQFFCHVTVLFYYIHIETLDFIRYFLYYDMCGLMSAGVTNSLSSECKRNLCDQLFIYVLPIWYLLNGIAVTLYCFKIICTSYSVSHKSEI